MMNFTRGRGPGKGRRRYEPMRAIDSKGGQTRATRVGGEGKKERKKEREEKKETLFLLFIVLKTERRRQVVISLQEKHKLHRRSIATLDSVFPVALYYSICRVHSCMFSNHSFT
jgi:hypothetical protein